LVAVATTKETTIKSRRILAVVVLAALVAVVTIKRTTTEAKRVSLHVVRARQIPEAVPSVVHP
jgi:hypothetical protein